MGFCKRKRLGGELQPRKTRPAEPPRGEILRNDGISESQPSMQGALTPDNSNGTRAICKNQSSNFGQHTRILARRTPSLTCFLHLHQFWCRKKHKKTATKWWAEEREVSDRFGTYHVVVRGAFWEDIGERRRMRLGQHTHEIYTHAVLQSTKQTDIINGSLLALVCCVSNLLLNGLYPLS